MSTVNRSFCALATADLACATRLAACRGAVSIREKGACKMQGRVIPKRTRLDPHLIQGRSSETRSTRNSWCRQVDSLKVTRCSEIKMKHFPHNPTMKLVMWAHPFRERHTDCVVISRSLWWGNWFEITNCGELCWSDEFLCSSSILGFLIESSACADLVQRVNLTEKNS